jgi:XTP/dITP diphosphohydrolase
MVEVASLSDCGVRYEVSETGKSFAANALCKAKEYGRVTGMWSLADDSGLEVSALDGAPGVYSARYAGPQATDEANVALLLENMSTLAEKERSARFRCVIALASPKGLAWTCEGQCSGSITFSPRGTNGFGYDPVFLLPKMGKTMAEIEPEQKDQISHRAEAARHLRAFFWYLVTH